MKEEELLKIIRTDIRCPYCNKLILKCKLWGDYNIEFVCPRCKSKTELKKFKRISKESKEQSK